MTFNSFLSDAVRYGSFLFNQVVSTGWGLIIISTTVLILMLVILMKKKKLKSERSVIHPSIWRQPPQKSSDMWEKGKTRIQKLLYEMTENMPTGGILNANAPRLSYSNKPDFPDYSTRQRPQRTLRERNVQKSRPNNASAPLDLQELREVASLAKNLRTRGHHRMHT